VRGQSHAKNGKRGLEDREFSSLCELPEASKARIRNNPFTAADEKIPLSVVDVNKKPQYLVFSFHFAHLIRKQRQSPVESSKAPGASRTSAAGFAPNPVQPGGLRPAPASLRSVVLGGEKIVLDLGVDGLGNFIADRAVFFGNEMALVWLLKDPRVTSVLIGASSIPQLDDNVAALNNRKFSKSELDEIELILSGETRKVKKPIVNEPRVVKPADFKESMKPLITEASNSDTTPSRGDFMATLASRLNYRK